MRHEISPGWRHFEERLEQQNIEHVLPADIDDESDLRLQRPHVREVLLGSHTKVNAAGFGELLQRRDDVLDARFIGDPVVAGIRP